MSLFDTLNYGDADKLLPLTVFVVEANNFEELSLWKSYHERLDWRAATWGVLRQVGELDGRPVMLSLKWHLIHGQLVLFVDPTSQVVDYAQVDSWLKRNVPALNADGRLPRCDAGNFHLCVQHVKDLQEAAAPVVA